MVIRNGSTIQLITFLNTENHFICRFFYLSKKNLQLAVNV